jgi:hypothetical protein
MLYLRPTPPVRLTPVEAAVTIAFVIITIADVVGRARLLVDG